MSPRAIAAAFFLVALTASPAAVQSQEVPGFLCRPVAADYGDMGRAPEYQRVDIQQPSTAVTLDVLFLYSADRAQFDAPSRIARYMSEANQIFRNSGTGITLRLAGAEQLPSGMKGLVRGIEENTRSNEHTLSRMDDVLNVLRRGIGTSDIQRTRSRTRADLVVLWTGMRRHVGSIRALGVALQPGPRSGFSAEKGFVILAGNPTQSGLLAHEIGHTLGLAHPRSARGAFDDPYLPHGQGYASGGYGTVMAYNTSAARSPINVFSMNGFYSGRRVGDRNHRAAEAASTGAQFVADYQRSNTPPPPDPEPEPPPDDPTDPFVLTLHDNRYAVQVDWSTRDGRTGSGRVVPETTADSGLFSFFDPDNWEVLIKVLDGCAANGHVWVFAASTTDLGYVIRVTDTTAGAVREYRNEPGVPAPALTDTEAFGCR